ncbi:hypothetical protein AURANDRAFT_66637 [Aureococcus anophagefferens]|uniref:Uncharacterized protein n=1 Tax=Aureococcus anophagefferens TaxID=44056 RepID=F0YI95_AURAN|nr:hypothetical protein AURANDRAFT_66637 [Aureococcus anophagefferens]EGB05206.1 hypothetical protein AURANDRAFT_66637 [Aureococcus anophagefferens]|eukprot:XP_009040107.1 hypothetical protein AURANDRAFT_66637 [Aureococcus anophagefferens]
MPSDMPPGCPQTSCPLQQVLRVPLMFNGDTHTPPTPTPAGWTTGHAVGFGSENNQTPQCCTFLMCVEAELEGRQNMKDLILVAKHAFGHGSRCNHVDIVTVPDEHGGGKEHILHPVGSGTSGVGGSLYLRAGSVSGNTNGGATYINAGHGSANDGQVYVRHGTSAIISISSTSFSASHTSGSVAASSGISIASGAIVTLSGDSGVTFSSSYVYGFERTTSAATFRDYHTIQFKSDCYQHLMGNRQDQVLGRLCIGTFRPRGPMDWIGYNSTAAEVLSPQPLSHARGAWVRRGPAQSRSAIAPAIIAAPVTQGELPVWRIAGLVPLYGA